MNYVVRMYVAFKIIIKIPAARKMISAHFYVSFTESTLGKYWICA